jgi:hypothetical protein
VQAAFHLVSIVVAPRPAPNDQLVVQVDQAWLFASVGPGETTPRFASQPDFHVGETHVQLVKETGELLVQFGATLPATLTRIIAAGAEVERRNIGRAALYWPQLLSQGWGTTLRRITRLPDHRGNRC